MLILWVVGAVFAGTGVWNYLELGTMVKLDDVLYKQTEIYILTSQIYYILHANKSYRAGKYIH